MNIKFERQVVTQEIKNLIGKMEFVHFSIRDEIITNFDDYIHYMKKDGKVVCVNIKTLERVDLTTGKDFNILFGENKAS